MIWEIKIFSFEFRGQSRPQRRTTRGPRPQFGPEANAATVRAPPPWRSGDQPEGPIRSAPLQPGLRGAERNALGGQAWTPRDLHLLILTTDSETYTTVLTITRGWQATWGRAHCPRFQEPERRVFVNLHPGRREPLHQWEREAPRPHLGHPEEGRALRAFGELST